MGNSQLSPAEGRKSKKAIFPNGESALPVTAYAEI